MYLKFLQFKSKMHVFIYNKKLVFIIFKAFLNCEVSLFERSQRFKNDEIFSHNK